MNKLINETSPYLLQHAHNPVNWYPWGDEALQLAQQQDKPILVSIGYSACHWCHVMERESFEDESTASVMNELFINIKIDREERPDLDHIYMDALQNMTGGGGWPLNVFLTPEGKPFYGGTYYPPRRAHNRPSWKEVLLAVADGYQNKKNDVLAQAENLTRQLANANNFGIAKTAEGDYGTIFSKENLATIAANILQQADAEWGGFGRAPKFPQTFSVQFLLRHYHYNKHQPSLQQALLSINKMMQGGIYDHIGGGFARYSTDTEWLAPHFEKMLYDNALLINIISEAYQLTGDARYAEVIEDTLAFLEREMLSPEGGFYSALDADSEGEEGRFYVWGKQQIADVLGPDADLFCKVYDITEKGNWEHNNIIWLKRPIEEVLLEAGVDPVVGVAILKNCREKLLAEREKRVRPGLDDKILTGWNALMVTACCKAVSATSNLKYSQLAQDCMLFLEEQCGVGGWKHTYKNGVAKYPAFLDDCAYLIQAYINLQEVTGNSTWLYKAKALTEQVLHDFSDNEQLLFYYTPAGQENLIVRKKEVYDGATPSGNSVMAQNLHHLSIIFNNNKWLARAQAMVASLAQASIKYPVSFGCWASVLQNIAIGTNEIAIVGADAHAVLQQLNSKYVPNKIVQASAEACDDFPLLAGKTAAVPDTLIYLCKNYACLKPVSSLHQLVNLL